MPWSSPLLPVAGCTVTPPLTADPRSRTGTISAVGVHARAPSHRGTLGRVHYGDGARALSYPRIDLLDVCGAVGAARNRLACR